MSDINTVNTLIEQNEARAQDLTLETTCALDSVNQLANLSQH